MWHTQSLVAPVFQRPEPIPDYRQSGLWEVDVMLQRRQLTQELLRCGHAITQGLSTASSTLQRVTALLEQLCPGVSPPQALRTLCGASSHPAVLAALSGSEKPSGGASSHVIDALFQHLCNVNEIARLADQIMTDISDAESSQKHLAHQIVLLHTGMIKMGDPLARHKKSIEQYFETIKQEIANGGAKSRLQSGTAAWLSSYLQEVVQIATTAPLPQAFA
eukprot:Hpha_TRINITY_DN7393_c0_g1::TRINITY_DN7393_c0_g1_i1::g.9875::m.9875